MTMYIIAYFLVTSNLLGALEKNAFIGTCTPLPLQQDLAKGRSKQVMYIALFHIRGYVDFVESPIETGDPRHDE